MAAVTIQAIEQGWDGDRKRNRAVVLLTSGYTVTPEQVGLKFIQEIIVPTYLADTDYPIAGTTVSLTSVGAITGTYSLGYLTLTSTGDGNVLIDFYGW